MFVKGQKAPNPFKKGNVPWNKGLNVSGHSGHKHSDEWKSFMSNVMSDRPNPLLQQENHPMWKGDNANYRSVHKWVARWKPETNTCEKCGLSGLTGHKIHWANIDHKYRRVLDDYIRLCTKCHGKHDKNLSK